MTKEELEDAIDDIVYFAIEDYIACSSATPSGIPIDPSLQLQEMRDALVAKLMMPAPEPELPVTPTPNWYLDVTPMAHIYRNNYENN